MTQNTLLRSIFLAVLTCATFEVVSSKPYDTAPDNITLIGFFPSFARNSAGPARASASRYAAEQINAGAVNLSGIPLTMTLIDIDDAPNNPQVNVLTKALPTVSNYDPETRNHLIGFIGESSSSVSQTLSIVAAAYGVVQVSPASTGTALSDKNTYETFTRTVASDTFQVNAVIAFFNRNKWRQAAAIATSDTYGLGGLTEFRNLASSNNIAVDIVVTFSSLPIAQRKESDTASLTDKLRAILASGVRIIFCHMLRGDARWMFQVARDLGLAGPNNKVYTWILTDGSAQTDGINQWLVGQSIVVKPVGGIGYDFDGVNNSNSFKSWWMSADNTTYIGTRTSPMNDYVPFSYDAVFVFAKVFERMINKRTLHKNTTAEEILKEIKNLTFVGLTGNIAFDSNLDRLSNVNYYYVTQNYTATAVPNGYYDYISKSVVLDDNFWPNGQAPSDGVKEPKKVSLSPALGYIIFAITVVLMAVTLVFIVLTIIWAEHPRIKAATFSFLIYILVAGLLAYSTIFVLYVEPNNTTCVMPLWFGHTAFFFAFGCLFTKTFRVWMIFSRAKKVSTKKIVIKDEHLLLIVGACTLLLWIYLSIWTYFDRPTASTVNSTTVEKEYYVACSPSNPGWYVGIYVPEVLSLIIGVFLSFKTRKIELLRFNESSNIAVCIYVLVFLGLLIIPMAHFIQLGQDWTFLVESGGILVATTSVIGFLFVPKFRAIINKKEEMGSTMKKTGSVITPPKESVESGN